jgi:hypothetical protein
MCSVDDIIWPGITTQLVVSSPKEVNPRENKPADSRSRTYLGGLSSLTSQPPVAEFMGSLDTTVV